MSALLIPEHKSRPYGASAAKKLGRKPLSALDTQVTSDTLLGWYRTLVAKKYDSSARRAPRRARTAVDIAQLVLRMVVQ